VQHQTVANNLHMCCFKHKIMAKTRFENLAEHEVVCHKKCYKKAAKSTAGLGWHNDGCEGVNDQNHSTAILITWLTKEGNYSNLWKGKSNGGKTKEKIAATIANEINAAGVKVKRSYRQVENKIFYLEKQLKDAYDFANRETGAGLLISDPPLFDDLILKNVLIILIWKK
jgi:hypothetical protein